MRFLKANWVWLVVAAVALVAIWHFFLRGRSLSLSSFRSLGSRTAPTDANAVQSDLSTMYEPAPSRRIDSAPSAAYLGAIRADVGTRRISLQ